jgi:hypothetical protein
MVIYPYDIKITGEWSAFFIAPWDWTGRHESDYYNDKQYRDGLVWEINEHGSMTTEKTYTWLKLDHYYIFAALVIDTNGDYSDITKFDVSVSYDGANHNVQEYADWWNGTNDGPGLQSLSTKPLFTKKAVRGVKYSQAESVETERQMVAHDVEILKR